MDPSRLEPFGLSSLAAGLLYSIGVLVCDAGHFRLHFIVLVLVIFVALLSITAFKYLKYRNNCERMDDFINSMRIE